MIRIDEPNMELEVPAIQYGQAEETKSTGKKHLRAWCYFTALICVILGSGVVW